MKAETIVFWLFLSSSPVGWSHDSFTRETSRIAEAITSLLENVDQKEESETLDSSMLYRVCLSSQHNQYGLVRSKKQGRLYCQVLTHGESKLDEEYAEILPDYSDLKTVSPFFSQFNFRIASSYWLLKDDEQKLCYVTTGEDPSERCIVSSGYHSFCGMWNRWYPWMLECEAQIINFGCLIYWIMFIAR